MEERKERNVLFNDALNRYIESNRIVHTTTVIQAEK